MDLQTSAINALACWYPLIFIFVSSQKKHSLLVQVRERQTEKNAVVLHPLLLALMACPPPIFVDVFNPLIKWNALGITAINRSRAPAVWKSVSTLVFEYSFDLVVEWVLLSKHVRPFT